MDSLEINVDLGPRAPVVTLERIIRGIRVAVDVACESQLLHTRRRASERMRFPTPEELSTALARFEHRGLTDVWNRASSELDHRNSIMEPEDEDLRPELQEGPDRVTWRRNGRHIAIDRRTVGRAVRSLHFEMATEDSLDLRDPPLYDALVADEVARLYPERLRIQTMTYSNPFGIKLFGSKDGVLWFTRVVDTIRDYKANKRLQVAKADVAEKSIDLDLETKRLANARQAEALHQDQANTKVLELRNRYIAQAMDEDNLRHILVQRAYMSGQIDIADAVKGLRSTAVVDLSALEQLQLEILPGASGKDDKAADHETIDLDQKSNSEKKQN